MSFNAFRILGQISFSRHFGGPQLLLSSGSVSFLLYCISALLKICVQRKDGGIRARWAGLVVKTTTNQSHHQSASAAHGSFPERHNGTERPQLRLLTASSWEAQRPDGEADGGMIRGKCRGGWVGRDQNIRLAAAAHGLLFYCFLTTAAHDMAVWPDRGYEKQPVGCNCAPRPLKKPGVAN